MSSLAMFATKARSHEGIKAEAGVIRRSDSRQSAASPRWFGPLRGPTIKTRSSPDANDTGNSFVRVWARFWSFASRSDAHRGDAERFGLRVFVSSWPIFFCVSLVLCILATV